MGNRQESPGLPRSPFYHHFWLSLGQFETLGMKDGENPHAITSGYGKKCVKSKSGRT